jgi:DNA repair exonuclease SbcCD ATPase subunit
MKSQQIRSRIERLRGSQSTLQRQKETSRTAIKENSKELRRYEQAREIVREVGLKTQQQLQYHISDITSLALEAVFDNPYELKAEFVQRRNKTECDLYFVRDSMIADPQSASGGGAVDVAAFALRVASWSMQNPRLRNTIILDEPMRFLSDDYQEQASKMLKEISDRMGIQFIIITHEQTLSEYADKTFQVKLRKGISKVE